MPNKLCSQCSHLSADDKFCEECGLSQQEINAARFEAPLAEPLPASVLAPATAPTLPQPAVTAGQDAGWLKMVDAAGKVGGLGGTLIAVFDFLSPRIALLPVAASVAVVGLLATVALRKFVAPSLPAANKFRMALAPEAGLHRSRMIIGTGMLSALMVTGAVWSNANEAGGGVIASKFDAAKNAQMQLGISQVIQAVQVVQKEQRVQTAVLEDIREGRTLNPRRELANQGILWTQSAFRAAVYSNDAVVVSLFMAGGMKWGPEAGFDLLVAEQNVIADLLISRPEQFDRDIQGQYRRDCYDFVLFFNQPSNETKALKEERLKKPKPLLTQDKQWLKLLCSNEKNKAGVQTQLQEQLAKYTVPTLFQCREKLLNPRNSVIVQLDQSTVSYKDIPFQLEKEETEPLRKAVSRQLFPSADEAKPVLNMNGRDFSQPQPAVATFTPEVIGAINDYCSKVSRRSAAESHGWSIESMRQIAAVVGQ